MSELQDTIKDSVKEITQSISELILDLKEDFSYLKDEVKDTFDSCESFEERGIYD